MKHKIILALLGSASVVSLLALSLAAPSQSAVKQRDAQDKASLMAQSGTDQAGPSKSARGPLQPEVASNGSWATIASTDPRLTKTLASSDVAQGRSMVGQRGAFRGTVAGVFIPASNSISMLTFSINRTDTMMAVVSPENYSKFPPLSQLEGQRVLVEGNFVLYRNARNKQEIVEIVLTDPSQVSIVQQ